MSEFSWVVTDPRLTLEVVEDHVEHVDGHPYLFDRFHCGDVVRIQWPDVVSSSTTGTNGQPLALMQSRSRLGMADNMPRPSGEATASLFAGEGSPPDKGHALFSGRAG